MTNIFKLFIPFAFLLTLSCDLEKEIEVEIPDFESGYVVESYIVPDEPFGMLITKSYGYFEVFDSNQLDPEQLSEILVQDVKGTLHINGKEFEIKNHHRLPQGSSMIYNYILSDDAFFTSNDHIEMHLNFPTGESVTAHTTIPEVRSLDSVRVVINDQGEARSQTYLTTDPDKDEFFRRQLFRVRDGRIATLQDFVTDNKIATNGNLTFGSGFDFNIGDTLVSRMTHITKDYFDFYTSVTGSISANSNPFSQPGKIASNIHGSDRVIGIFTSMTPSEKSRIIGK